MDRRQFLLTGALAGAALPTLHAETPQPTASPKAARLYQNGRSPWPICLDTATIRPVDGLEKMVEIAIEAGYDAIEPWDRDLADYESKGGDLKALGKQIREAGMFVPSMIGLWGCLPENEEAFQKSLPATRKRMRMAADIGCTHVQAIPNQVGNNYDVQFVASCYRRLLEIGLNEYNVIPALVFVKMFPLKTLGQAAAVVLDADHPQARLIPDVFHMYISEGGFSGLPLINGKMIAIFQFNDAPKNMKREDMEDRHRVFPGDGILPLPQILRDLKETGFDGCISLELYNPEYYKRDLLEVARTGLEKTLKVIDKAKVV